MPKYCRFKPPPMSTPLYCTVAVSVRKRRRDVALSPHRTTVGGFDDVKASKPVIHDVKP